MNELKTAKEYEDTCNSSVLPLTTAQHYSWVPVPKTWIGAAYLDDVGTVTFTIPSVIPSTAREVLIYAGAYTGYIYPVNLISDLKIFTQIGTCRYEKYLLMLSMNQHAFNTNSDNMWFPMPSDRRVYVTVPVAYTKDSTRILLYAIGYR